MAKKTNYIAHEIQKLEKYIEQLYGYLDKHPPDLVTDRIEVLEFGDKTIVKVIASIETQVKEFRTMVKEMPALLEGLNKLRRIADDKPEDKQLRAGFEELPGFMDDAKDEDEEDEEDDD